METSTRAVLKYSFGIVAIVLGVVLNHFDVGTASFAGFGSVGTWLICIGFLSLIISTFAVVVQKKRVVDERMLFVAAKANRIVFLSLVIIAFIVIVIDGIRPITMPYYLFMSYLVCVLMLVYFVSYKLLLRFN